MPFGYLTRLAAAESTPDDPRGEGALVRQMTVVFDHYLAKALVGPDPIEGLKRFGFIETAAILEARIQY
ncbi:hypothetical protein VO63_05035 [Streptomyces showdoensis]|uniref:Uncharacterized protein n=1 Tax=Streptomyces showdoensis TaxID=68268 RepID=A0A2P2GTL3_STREW|nr:hypothetical protein VO63_05035 [Streptomyces showdoensis]